MRSAPFNTARSPQTFVNLYPIRSRSNGRPELCAAAITTWAMGPFNGAYAVTEPDGGAKNGLSLLQSKRLNDLYERSIFLPDPRSWTSVKAAQTLPRKSKAWPFGPLAKLP